MRFALPLTAPSGTETSRFSVVLDVIGEKKIQVIKVVRELVPDLGLKDAKDLVEAAPQRVLEGVDKATADAAKASLEAAGAKATAIAVTDPARH